MTMARRTGGKPRDPVASTALDEEPSPPNPSRSGTKKAPASAGPAKSATNKVSKVAPKTTAPKQQAQGPIPSGNTQGEAVPVGVSTWAQNKTTRPGQIVNDAKQQHRSPDTKHADEAAKRAAILAEKLSARSQRQAAVKSAAVAEDRVRQEDLIRQRNAERPDLADTNPSARDAGEEELEDGGPESADIPEPSEMADDESADYSMDTRDEEHDNEDPPAFVEDDWTDLEDSDADYIDHGIVTDEEMDEGLEEDDFEAIHKPRKNASLSKKRSQLRNLSPECEADLECKSGLLGQNARHQYPKTVRGQRSWQTRAKSSIGGLKSGWDKIKNRTSIASEEKDDKELSYDDPKGEFATDEASSLLAAVRAGKVCAPKKNGNTAPQILSERRTTAQMGIKLELEAHQSSLPNGDARRLARKSQGEPTARDLPFPPGRARQYAASWKEFCSTLINWFGTLDDPLAAASNPEFEEMVEKLWNKIFPELAEKLHSNRDVIVRVSQGILRNHRSAVGKAGVAIFAQLIPVKASFEDVNTIKAAYRVPRFIYRDPDAENNRGSFLSPLLLQVFASHLTVIMCARESYGRPIGALALTCASLERAIDGWQQGINRIDEAGKKNDKKTITALSFKNDTWGAVAVRWARKIETDLTDKRWDVLIREASAFLPNDRVAKTLLDDPELEPEGDRDVCEAVQVSDDEYL
ncbi:hypothetical protein HGRIS_011076 [Hohenbuehelia grisea]|uniref:Uncharacterized protein n=1 Tax=Hohenbuehelia grisea TaxID=104357 RepID=A0ABR3IYW6_9AGAR